MYSPESNQRMGRIVVGLGPEVAVTIAAAMKQMEDTDTAQPDVADPSEYEITSEISTPAEPMLEKPTVSVNDRLSFGTSGERDPELEQEEKLIQAFKVIQDLENNNAKAANELEELRQDKEELQQAFDAFKYEVETQGRKAAENDALKDMQLKAERDRDYIAELEVELETLRDKSQTQERQIERYKTDTDAKQKLRDDMQLLRAERDDLLQKTRMNENLKKKIQALQDQEKASVTLREDLRSANDRLQDLDRLKDQCATLQKANAENLKLIANGEQEIFDQKTTRKRIEHEFKVLTQKWESAKERQVKDHENITELENKLQTLELGGSNTTGAGGGLGDELEASEKARAERAMSRSQANTIPSADATILQQKLDSITSRNHKLETEYLDILQDKLGLETALQDLREPSREPEENVPFLEQRKKLQAAQAEIQDMRNQQFGANTEMANIKERLMAVQKQLTDQDVQLDGNAEYQTLTDRYSELHKHSEGVEAELAEQRALLRHALLNAAQLLKESAESRNENEYKLLLQQLQAVRDAPDDDELLESTAAQLADRMEQARSDTIAANKVCYLANTRLWRYTNTSSQLAEDRATEIATLKKQINSGATATTTGNIPSAEFAALQRENKLMTSAWFDLSSRLQSNTVMLGRRKESPKSFLGKQRQLVTPGLVSGQVR
jgi:protein HOOK3